MDVAMKLSPCKKVLSLLLALTAAALSAVLVVSACVVDIAAPRLLSAAQAAELKDVDCILVLGCQVLDDGTPSLMLRDRLDTAIALYEAGAAPKLLMSGDHSREDYDEVGAMKRYAMAAGVPSEDIFLDHAGFSTYESIYRAKALFGAEKILIVTQEYHLYRAVYIAQKLGLEAWGVPAEGPVYAGQSMREVREILARCKDVLTSTLQLPPAGLEGSFSLDGSGDVTDAWNAG